MSNARPSNRQLAQFHAALQQAATQASSIPSLSELARRRDAHLAALRQS